MGCVFWSDLSDLSAGGGGLALTSDVEDVAAGRGLLSSPRAGEPVGDCGAEPCPPRSTLLALSLSLGASSIRAVRRVLLISSWPLHSSSKNERSAGRLSIFLHLAVERNGTG